MKRVYFKLTLLVLQVISLFVIPLVNGEAEEDTWMDPDAWARDHLASVNLDTNFGKCCKCSNDNVQEDGDFQDTFKGKVQTDAEDAASLIYFKKFVTMLFSRKHFKYDSTLQTYERSIVFSVQSQQMEKLEQLQDPRDLDNILAEIFNNVRTPNMYYDGHQQLHTTDSSNGFKALVFDIFYDMWQLTKTSEIRFLLVVTIVILIAWIVNTRFNIGWVVLIFGGFFIYGYLYTYLECNRELEVTQMMEILNRNKGKENIANDSKFVKFLKGIFYSADSQDVQKQNLKQSAKLSLGFCRPDHVLIMYFNDIFLKYLQLLLEQFTVTLAALNENLGFPYNMLSGFLLVCIMGYILKLTFKYILSPSAWAQFMHRTPIYHAAIINANAAEINDDRISGDNLKLLLNAINAAPQRTGVPQNQSAVSAVSGVEELSEAIEPPPKNISPQLVKNTVAIKHNNNVNEISPDKTKDVYLEDLFDDS